MRLVMYAHNGMHWCMREDATHLDLRNLVRKRIKQGYEVEWISPNRAEVIDDGTTMINDNHGVIALVSDDHKIHEAGE